MKTAIASRSVLVGRLLAVVIAVALAAITVFPGTALAKDYSMTGVSVTGTADVTGDFGVVEERTFEFDGNFHAVDWDIPVASIDAIDVIGVAEIDADGNVVRNYRLSSSETPGYYNVTRRGDGIRITANFDITDATVTFRVGYVFHDAVKAWADTGEIHWKPVGPGWGKMSENVRVELVFPVPEGESVTLGENVRAWADGPLDGVISQEGDNIVFSCPAVNSGQYLDVLCAFPVEWLTGMAPSSEARLEQIMETGRSVAEAANAERNRARAIGIAGIAGTGVLGAFSVVFLALKHRKIGREYEPEFKDTYWRDVPSNDHPAVIGRIWRNKGANEDLTATLMRLTDMGVIKLERATVTKKRLLRGEKEVEDWRLTFVPEKFVNVTSDIDKKALDLVFETASKADRDEDMPQDKMKIDPMSRYSVNSVLLSDFRDAAKDDPEQFRKRYFGWEAKVDSAADRYGLFEAKSIDWEMKATAIAALELLAGVLAILGFDIWGPVPGIILLVCGVVNLFFARTMKRRTKESRELVVKTEALKKWLCDFTNLKEAIPTDVILWKKLLVMAVVLGVSDRVIKDLKVTVPQVFEDPYFTPIYMWCSPSYGLAAPSVALADVVSQAHSISTHDLAGTLDSSLFGGGGGFGGGGFSGSFGGGGFGGGGGGAR